MIFFFLDLIFSSPLLLNFSLLIFLNLTVNLLLSPDFALVFFNLLVNDGVSNSSLGASVDKSSSTSGSLVSTTSSFSDAPVVLTLSPSLDEAAVVTTTISSMALVAKSSTLSSFDGCIFPNIFSPTTKPSTLVASSSGSVDSKYSAVVGYTLVDCSSTSMEISPSS